MFAFTLISCETEVVREEVRETSYKEFVDIVLANFDWGRASKDCKNGFGICNFEWGPKDPPTLPPLPPPPLPPDWGVPPMGPGPGGGGSTGDGSGMSVPVILVGGKAIIDLFVLEPNLNLEKTNMIIDEAIVRKLGKQIYKLPAGEIEYSPDMGKYGGYRIIFEAL
ncbi:hypothetical protein [Myroides odoratus]|uniref:hypothetical protein n=1 Tax=Myroides odoratus TaxID=256 RepID=UPI0039AF6533